MNYCDLLSRFIRAKPEPRKSRFSNCVSRKVRSKVLGSVTVLSANEDWDSTSLGSDRSLRKLACKTFSQYWFNYFTYPDQQKPLYLLTLFSTARSR